ncbi:hypothetical protein [Rhodococcus sp. W8901]|uniref:hypothetical protein n=1 Tax=Rhodococcus sp. W8901 TaxID=2742603 RepID=UPI001583C701|nr:hypothetical protein [Rhodococcus sp. W8901]QKT09415.1 hypothetical protein HUN07_00490 [Rhodococcus sp. W8901]
MTAQVQEPLVGSCSYVHVAESGATAAAVDYDELIKATAMCGGPAEAKDRVHEVKTVVDPDIHLAMFDVDALPHDLLVDTMGMFPADVMP